MTKIILASSSIYRKELLERLQISFECYSPDIDETPRPKENIQDLVKRLAAEKAQAAAKIYPTAICIGSDELATLNNQLLGKPGNHEAAIQQLQLISNQRISFHTAVSVYSHSLSHLETRLVTTAVKFRVLTPFMIENYLQKEKPYFSAASFKSETLGSALIERFEGDDPTALIGLPLIALCDMLHAVNVDILAFSSSET